MSAAWQPRSVATVLLAGAALLGVPAAHAGLQASGSGLCEASHPLSATLQDQRLQFVARLRQELQESGRSAALIARSGLDLARFGLRDSHAGISLRDSPNTPWSVRQLYYACDEGQPRLFDQGLAGFLLAADEQAQAHVTLLLLPPAPTAALRAVALDRRQALHLLGAHYSANAYAFSTIYQNCNQWVAELLAVALAGPDLQPGAGDALRTRAQAQAWLQAHGYEPHAFTGSPWVYLLSVFVPLLHHVDHPEGDQAAAVYRVSMPASIEAFVQRQIPGTERIELCHDDTRIVVRRGWRPLGPDCTAGPGDETQLLAGANPLPPRP
ncbi:MAG: DUF2145 domain-containing protein [Rubrivivax sp.]|nr:DUF2145 domain-containing protein [Rubrivivax sp.]